MKIPSKALAIGAATVIIASGTFGAFHYASAQEGTSTPSTATASATPGTGANGTKRQQAVDAFLGKVATNLNVSADQLKTALKDAGTQTIDGLVSSGKLTQAQATKLKDAINSGKYPELSRLFRRGAARRLVAAKLIVTSSAKAINIQPADLKTELKAGKSIADVAGEHNISLDTVKTQITTDAKAKLDTAVQNGKITQAREDAAMTKLESSLDKILSRHKGDTTAPAASATPGA
jgi:hypothetical protein